MQIKGVFKMNRISTFSISCRRGMNFNQSQSFNIECETVEEAKKKYNNFKNSQQKFAKHFSLSLMSDDMVNSRPIKTICIN